MNDQFNMFGEFLKKKIYNNLFGEFLIFYDIFLLF